MAITFVGSALGTVTTIGQTLGTVAITISGANPLLVVSIMSDISTTASGVGFNGNSMTQAASGSLSSESSSIWYLEAPPAGAGSVIATVTNSGSDRVLLAQNYAGVLQTGALAVAGSAVGTSAAISFIGTASEGSCLMVDAAFGNGDPGTVGAGQTTLTNQDLGFFFVGASYEILGAATTIGTMSWGQVSDAWVTSVAAFKSAATGGGGITIAGWKSLLGVGQG